MMENKNGAPAPMVTKRERDNIRAKYEQEVGEELIEKKYPRINKVVVYEDPNDFSSVDLKKLPPAVAFPVEMLIMHVKLPILIDDIEELGANTERMKIKDQLARETDPVLLRLYEKNKLQSSDIASCLEMLKMLQATGIPFSEEILNEIEATKVSFSGANKEDQTAFKGRKYLNETNNAEKLLLVQKFEALLEQVIKSVVASNGTEVK